MVLSLRRCTVPEPDRLLLFSKSIERLHVPVLQLSLAIPELHRPLFTPAFGEQERSCVVLCFEFTKLIDMSARPIDEIEAIIMHALPPPSGRVK